MDFALLEKEYQAKAGLYVALCEETVTQLTELLRAERITLASELERRFKTWTSIVDNIERNKYQPSSISEIGDIAGIRIIALFRRDIEKIENLIESNFEVLHKEDAFARLTEEQFGYGSIHYEVKPLVAWLKVPTLRKLEGLRAELQVRTGSQHIWAAASHIFQYKKEAHVPIPVRRSINRVAALLETVDLEFERVLREREQYAQEIREEKGDLQLNTETLSRLLGTLLPAKNLNANGEQYADLLDECVHFGVNTTDHLKQLIKKHWDAMMAAERIEVRRCAEELSRGEEPAGTSRERHAAGVYFTHVGLCRTILLQEFGKAFRDYQVQKKTPKK